MKQGLLPGGLIVILMLFFVMALQGQDNLAHSAAASADTSHVDYPALAAINGDTLDDGGWGVSARDTIDQSGINIAPQAIATADESSENGSPAGAIDGDTADWTGWSVTSTFEHAPHWLELSWDSVLTMSRIVLFTNSAKAGAFALRAYDIQYWENSSWQPLASVSENTEAEVTSTFAELSTTKIRILTTESV